MITYLHALHGAVADRSEEQHAESEASYHREENSDVESHCGKHERVVQS